MTAKPEDLTCRTVRIKPYNHRAISADVLDNPYPAGDIGTVKETDFRNTCLTYRVYVFYRPEPNILFEGKQLGMWLRRQDLEVVDG